MKILELFSGYGTATFALKRLGIPHEVVEAERIAKTWSRIIHCSYIDLINEASVQLGGGI